MFFRDILIVKLIISCFLNGTILISEAFINLLCYSHLSDYKINFQHYLFRRGISSPKFIFLRTLFPTAVRHGEFCLNRLLEFVVVLFVLFCFNYTTLPKIEDCGLVE